ncbi:hypothetical protein AOX55_00003685 [Sinorhizobium fredii CCBAU 25509]|nr:hypothetical protein AOX55_00003685 [Sinorhizobium fredii CCBAU 25509]
MKANISHDWIIPSRNRVYSIFLRIEADIRKNMRQFEVRDFVPLKKTHGAAARRPVRRVAWRTRKSAGRSDGGGSPIRR